jgi:hypothetical protein
MFMLVIKVPLNQIFSNYNTMLWTIKYRFSSITVYFTFTVPELWPFFSFNLYLIVHSIVLNFEKIWLSDTLNIIQKSTKTLFS